MNGQEAQAVPRSSLENLDWQDDTDTQLLFGNRNFYGDPNSAENALIKLRQESWDSSLAMTEPKRNKVKLIGNTNFEARLNVGNVFGNCIHELIKTSCLNCRNVEFMLCTKCFCVKCIQPCGSQIREADPDLVARQPRPIRHDHAISSTRTISQVPIHTSGTQPEVRNNLGLGQGRGRARLLQFRVSTPDMEGVPFGLKRKEEIVEQKQIPIVIDVIKEDFGKQVTAHVPRVDECFESNKNYAEDNAPKVPTKKYSGETSTGGGRTNCRSHQIPASGKETITEDLLEISNKAVVFPIPLNQCRGRGQKIKPLVINMTVPEKANCEIDLELPLHKQVFIEVATAVDLEDFYVLRADDLSEIERMERHIQRVASFSSDPLNLTTLPVVGCLPLSYNKWVRCKVLRIQGRTCDVQLIDSGEFLFDVNPKELRVLPKLVKDFHPFAYHCRLDIKPIPAEIIWNNRLCQALRDMRKHSRISGDHIDGGHMTVKCIGYENEKHVVKMGLITDEEDWGTMLVNCNMAVRASHIESSGPENTDESPKAKTKVTNINTNNEESYDGEVKTKEQKFEDMKVKEDQSDYIEKTSDKSTNEIKNNGKISDETYRSTSSLSTRTIKDEMEAIINYKSSENAIQSLDFLPPLRIVQENLELSYKFVKDFIIQKKDLESLLTKKFFLTGGGAHNLYIVPKDNRTLSELDIQDEINEWAEKAPEFPIDVLPVVDDVVIAYNKAKEIKKYFRGLVKVIDLQIGVMEVYDIDHGTTCHVDTRTVKYLNDKLMALPMLGYIVEAKSDEIDDSLILDADVEDFLIRKRNSVFVLESITADGQVSLRDSKTGKFIESEIKELGKWQWENVHDRGCYHTDDEIANKGSWSLVQNMPMLTIPLEVGIPSLICRVDVAENETPYLMVQPRHHNIDRMAKVFANQVQRYMSKVKPSNYYPPASEIFFLLPPEGQPGGGVWQRCTKIMSRLSFYLCIDTGVKYIVEEKKEEYKFRRMCPDFLKVPKLLVTVELPGLGWDEKTTVGQRSRLEFAEFFKVGETRTLFFSFETNEDVRYAHSLDFGEHIEEIITECNHSEG